MCINFDAPPLVFGENFQNLPRVCRFLHKGFTKFRYPSEKSNNLTDANDDFVVHCMNLQFFC